ncbi:hypothetical protein [Clostridium sp. LP20]|uniref:hypothetical protein n=1 Tax=Clostridium sp. LP20 TaxID=3418665 RepID=UPI003EE5E483
MQNQLIRNFHNILPKIKDNTKFKSFTVSRLVAIPSDKPGINTVLKSSATTKILSTNIVEIPNKAYLNKNPSRTYKLFFKGSISSNVKYISNNENGSIYYDNFELFFVESLTSLDRSSYGNNNIVVNILDISASKFNSHSIFISLILFVQVI